MKFLLSLVLMMLLAAADIQAQDNTTDVRKETRTYTARNFSELRTLNVTYSVIPSSEYTLTRDGETVESGRLAYTPTLKFQTTFPIVRKRKFSIYTNANLQYVHKELQSLHTANTYSLWQDDNEHNIDFDASLSLNYHTQLFRRPLIIIGTAGLDGWKHGIEQPLVSLTGTMLLKQTATTRFMVGLRAMYPFIMTPVIPIIMYSRQITPKIIFDCIMPSGIYLRYQQGGHRLSLGAQLEGDGHYIQGSQSISTGEYPASSTPKATYYVYETSIKPTLLYEYIINRHFYLKASGGVICPFKGGIYDTDRRARGKDPHIEFNRSSQPYFSLGVSYNLY